MVRQPPLSLPIHCSMDWLVGPGSSGSDPLTANMQTVLFRIYLIAECSTRTWQARQLRAQSSLLAGTKGKELYRVSTFGRNIAFMYGRY